MSARVLSIVKAEAEAGFPRVRGTTVNARRPVTDAILNDFLSRFAVPLPTGHIIPGNIIRFGPTWIPFGPSITILRVDPSLKVTVRGGGGVDLVLSAVAKAFVTRDAAGNLVVDIKKLPNVSQYDYLLRYVTNVSVHTSAGRMVLEIAAVF